MSAPEQQHHDVDEAYERLVSSLALPTDLLTRVEGRIRARRRRRRTAAVVAAASVVLGGAAVVWPSPGEDGPPVAVDPLVGQSGLTIALEDGSPYTFTDVEVTCRREQGVQVIEATNATGPVGDPLDAPLLLFTVDVRDVADGMTFDLPYRLSGDGVVVPPDQAQPMMVLFYALPGDSDANELSSSQDGASGTVEVVSASCGEEPHLELRVDATLGSEVSQGPGPINGYLDQ